MTLNPINPFRAVFSSFACLVSSALCSSCPSQTKLQKQPNKTRHPPRAPKTRHPPQARQKDKQHVHRQLPCSAPAPTTRHRSGLGIALSTSPPLPPFCLSAKGRDGHIAADSKGVWSPGLHLGVEVAGAELEGVRALLALLLVFVRTHDQCVCPAQACRRFPCYAEVQLARSKPDTHPKDGGIHEKCEHAVFRRGIRVSTFLTQHTNRNTL